MLLRGEVTIERGVPAFDGATLRVQVLDVTEQDAPSVVVAETSLPVSHRVGTDERIPFEVDVEARDPSARYSLAAHVDLSGSGEVERGDLVTVASHDVASGGMAGPVVLPVRPVG